MTKVLNTTVNIAEVAMAFPLLDPLVRDMLQVQNNNASGCAVLKDTLASDGVGSAYLLKKGAMLLIPSAVIHRDPKVWGPTAQAFDPTRFMKIKKGKVSRSVWRTLGGGNSLCSRRYLATHEMESILIVMVWTSYITPSAKDGLWKSPKTRTHILTSI